MDSTMPSGTLVEVTNNPVTAEENAERSAGVIFHVKFPDALSLYMARYLTPHDFANLMLICKSVHHALRGGPGQFYLPAFVIRKEGCKPFMPMIEQSYHGTLDDKGRLSNQSYRLVLPVQGESTEAKTYQQLLAIFNSGYALALLTGQGAGLLKTPQTEAGLQLNKAFKDTFASALSFCNINLKQTSPRFKKHHSLYYLHTLNALSKLLQCDDETEEANAKKIKALCYLRDNVNATRKLYENPGSEKALRACIDTLHTNTSATRRNGEYRTAFFMALGLTLVAIAICSLIFVWLGLAFHWGGIILLVCSLLYFATGFGGGLIIFASYELLEATKTSFEQSLDPNQEDAILPALHDWQELQYEVIHHQAWRFDEPTQPNNLSFFSLKPEEPIDDEDIRLGLDRMALS